MHILTSICPGEDSPDLFSHWLEHYRQSGMLRFHILLAENPAHTLSSSMRELLSSSDITITAVSKPAQSEQERVELFSRYKLEVLSSERMIFAMDVDEFLTLPGELHELACSLGVDYVRGRLVDRFAFDGRTPKVYKSPSIWRQFPVCSCFSWDALGALQTKTPLSKPEVAFTVGLHRVIGQDELHRPPWDVTIAHFKWCEGIIAKLRRRLERNRDKGAFLGEKYKQECRYFLENHVIGEEQIHLKGISTWYQPHP